MTWTSFEDDAGRLWQINEDALYAVARGSAHAKLMRTHTKEVPSAGWSPFAPKTYEVQTDFSKVGPECDRLAAQNYDFILRGLSKDPAKTLRVIEGMLTEAKEGRKWLSALRQNAMRKSMSNIQEKVKSLEIGESNARIIRNLSISTLVTLATISTGGAAAGALGAGARMSVLGGAGALRGVATYQDTGHVGASLLTATSTVTVGLVGLWGNQVQADKMALFFVQTGMKAEHAALQTYVKGDTVDAAIRSALVSTAGSAGSKLVSGLPSFKNLPLEARVALKVVGKTTGQTGMKSVLGGDRITKPILRGGITHAIPAENQINPRDFIYNNVIRFVGTK